MHGDIDNPADAVISKDDYEAYPLKMGAFVSALRGDLVEKTFLFLGFSFTDPNYGGTLSFAVDATVGFVVGDTITFNSGPIVSFTDEITVENRRS